MAILPAGSFNTQRRVYTAFKVGDVVEGGVERVTRGLWSANVPTLPLHNPLVTFSTPPSTTSPTLNAVKTLFDVL